MVDAWTQKWSYDTPKASVVSLLTSSLAALQSAALSAPSNEELQLLIGLTARYAYNVDVESAYQVAVDAFTKAQKLAPDDYRPPWFLGIHQCQANVTEAGMNEMLAVEEHFPWQTLPIDFWDDYIFCAAVSSMPAHELRAADYLEQLHAPPSASLASILDAARKRFENLDISSKIKGDDLWETEKSDGKFVITNFAFGLSFLMPADWGVRFPDMENGICYVQMQTEADHGKTGDVYPNIMIISRLAKPQETLKDFAKQFLSPMQATPITVADCPAGSCSAFEAVKRGMYGAEGDGYASVRVFQREAPMYPGLLLERPAGPPTPQTGNQTTYYRPNQRFRRLTGKLYYLVLLDSASSVLPQAKKDFDEFLRNLKIE